MDAALKRMVVAVDVSSSPSSDPQARVEGLFRFVSCVRASCLFDPTRKEKNASQRELLSRRLSAERVAV